jgi:hypothetical protein
MMYHQTSIIKKFRLMMRFFSSSSISRQHFFENYLIRVFVLIFCRIVFHRCFQIFAAKLLDTLHKIFFFLSWKNWLLCTCWKISFRWIWRRDNHLRRLFLNFKFKKNWWNHILSNIIIIIDHTQFDVDFSRPMREHLCKICMREKPLKGRKTPLYAPSERPQWVSYSTYYVYFLLYLWLSFLLS